MLPTAHYRPVIDAMASFVALPAWNIDGDHFSGGEWFEGLVLTESAGNADAVRYERRLDPNGHDDGMFEEAKSYGLVQLLGTTIRRLCGVPAGTRVDFTFALLPIVNLSLGLRLLEANLVAAHGDVAGALARYNAGWKGAEKDASGQLRAQAYVDRVRANASLVHIDRAHAFSTGAFLAH